MLAEPWYPGWTAEVNGHTAAVIPANGWMRAVPVPAGTRLAVGDPVIFRHAKAGELCERFRELLLIRGNVIEARVPTYRGQEQCFV